MSAKELNRVRKIVLAMPEVNERVSHGAICFFIGKKKPICYFHDNHREDGRVSLWCPAFPDVLENLVRNRPELYYKPQTSSSGTFSEWLGIYLDVTDEYGVDWKELTRILEDAFRKVAPKKLVNKYDMSVNRHET